MAILTQNVSGLLGRFSEHKQHTKKRHQSRSHANSPTRSCFVFESENHEATDDKRRDERNQPIRDYQTAKILRGCELSDASYSRTCIDENADCSGNPVLIRSDDV